MFWKSENNASALHRTNPLQNGIQHLHIVLLRFDRVREERVGLIRDQLINRHTFHGHDDVRFTEILSDDGSGGNVVLDRVGTSVTRLDEHADAGLGEPFDMRRGERSTTFPCIYGFSSGKKDSDNDLINEMVFCRKIR